MQIQLLTRVPSAEVRALAIAAAERDEPLDTVNVFPIGTSQHAVFISEYLVQTFALDGDYYALAVLAIDPEGAA